jgi:hypothetical protein
MCKNSFIIDCTQEFVIELFIFPSYCSSHVFQRYSLYFFLFYSCKSFLERCT